MDQIIPRNLLHKTGDNRSKDLSLISSLTLIVPAVWETTNRPWPTIFLPFIDNFLTLRIDFKIGIVTQDSAVNLVAPGTLNSRTAARNPTDFKNLFKEKINVGTGGTWPEAPQHYTKLFLTDNPTWPRADAYLIIIIVSDTNEHFPGRWNIPPTNQHGIDFANYLKGLKNDKNLVRLFAIIDTKATHPQISAGITHKTAVDTLGKGAYYDIHSPFDDILNSIGTAVTRLATQFKITRKLDASEIENLKVLVNGTEQPKAAWTFNASSNSISFNSGHAPSPGSQIDILFGKPPAFLYLKRKLDKSRLEKTEIIVNGRPIPRDHWDYDEQKNAILFLDGHIPPLGSRIKITYSDRI